MSDTPRTDALHDRIAPQNGPVYCYDEMINHARVLERELAKAREKNKILEDECEQMIAVVQMVDDTATEYTPPELLAAARKVLNPPEFDDALREQGGEVGP